MQHCALVCRCLEWAFAVCRRYAVPRRGMVHAGERVCLAAACWLHCGYVGHIGGSMPSMRLITCSEVSSISP